MAYVSSNSAPQLMVMLPGRGTSTGMLNYGGNLWWYTSTADNLSTVVGSSYFSDGWNRGMRKYDTVVFQDVGSTLTSIITVTSFSSASGGVTCASELTS